MRGRAVSAPLEGAGDGSAEDAQLQAWLRELQAAPVDAEQATTEAFAVDSVVASYNKARRFLWDEGSGPARPPLIDEAASDGGADADDDDWETELQAADREEEFKAFQSHYNENSVRCGVESCAAAIVASVRLLLPSLGFAVVQFWVASTSDQVREGRGGVAK